VRLFVGAAPSDSVRHAAAKIGVTVRAALESKHPFRGFRWVPADNLHITVWFLGEVPEQRSAAVLDVLGPPLSASAFRLHLSGLGTFPASGSPRVLWMGVSEGLEGLASAHEAVGVRLAALGFQPDGRPYAAHLTMARMKQPVPPAVRGVLRAILTPLEADAGRCRIDALTVFRSRTFPKGPVYEPLLRVPLS
jgi:2'-5' RNA ligase